MVSLISILLPRMGVLGSLSDSMSGNCCFRLLMILSSSWGPVLMFFTLLGGLIVGKSAGMTPSSMRSSQLMSISSVREDEISGLILTPDKQIGTKRYNRTGTRNHMPMDKPGLFRTQT